MKSAIFARVTAYTLLLLALFLLYISNQQARTIERQQILIRQLWLDAHMKGRRV